MDEKPKRKRKPAKPKKKLTPKQEAFTEHYMANGGNGAQAAKAAGYKGNRDTLKQVASENLAKPYIASRVRERLDGLQATTDEVLNLLADHLRVDIGDFDGCINEDGSLDLKEAKERGVSRLVKKIRSHTTFRDDKDGNTTKEVRSEIEFHDSQSAAMGLAKILGIQQQPRKNEKDLEDMRKIMLEAVADARATLGLDEESARIWVKQNITELATWVN